jgi:tripartite-type tricarboxylate transporter receptor subunit TctC
MMKAQKRPRSVFNGLFAGFLICLAGPAVAASQTHFYQGKTITLVYGSSPGGTGDMRVKSVITHLKKHIPGNPNIVIEYMPGGGGRKAANHVFHLGASSDGLTLGAMTSALVPGAVLGESGVLYDLDKFIYLGSPYSGVQYVFVTSKKAGLDNLEKLQARPGVRIGAQSVGHIVYNSGRIFAYLLGMKEPRFITGYSGREVDIALISGEVDARANIPETIVRRAHDWIEKRLVDFHAIVEAPKGQGFPHPVFAKLPELESFAKSENERKLLEMYRRFAMVGSPLVLPPGTPRDKAQILKEAISKTFNDPEFKREYKKLTGEDPTPLMLDEQHNTIAELPRDPTIVELFKKLSGPGPLPPR